MLPLFCTDNLYQHIIIMMTEQFLLDVLLFNCAFACLQIFIQNCATKTYFNFENWLSFTSHQGSVLWPMGLPAAAKKRNQDIKVQHMLHVNLFNFNFDKRWMMSCCIGIYNQPYCRSLDGQLSWQNLRLEDSLCVR